MTNRNEIFLDILRQELIQAQGCTEPIAIAYAAAKTRQTLGTFPDSIELACSGNIVKNAMGVVVPNSGGMRGIDVAAILGTIAGDRGDELEVLKDITADDIERMKNLLYAGFCKCTLCKQEEPLYIDITAFSGEKSARVVIRHTHTNITEIHKNGQTLLENTTPYEESSFYRFKSELTMDSILAFAESADIEALKKVFSAQVELNEAIANEGLARSYGAEVGRTVMKNREDCVRTRACAKAAAGSDARMGGCILPVVINSGSGNQGITVSVPVIEYARALDASEEKMFRALAISNLTAIHLKSYIGSLSAFCGAVCAACGSGAAITYLLGGGSAAIGRTITNTLGNVGGIICDGAKSSCAAKIFSSLNSAILAAEMSMSGLTFQAGEGIVAEDVETTIRNTGYIGKVGMRATDNVVLQLMLSRGAKK